MEDERRWPSASTERERGRGVAVVVDVVGLSMVDRENISSG